MTNSVVRFQSIFKRATAIALSISLVLPSPVWAWGAEGHELVGAVADRLLKDTPAARRIESMLQGRTLAQVAGWADCLKNVNPDANFEYANVGRYVDCKIFENPEDMAKIIAFVKRNHDSCFGMSLSRESCHKHYHYADLNLTQTRYAYLGFGSASEDIVQAMQAAIEFLQGRAVAEPFHFANESEALLLLVHLVGDVHQPLHVAGVYLDDDGRMMDDIHERAPQGKSAGGTAGGNALLFEQTNLHSMWDKISPAVKENVWRNFETASAAPSSMMAMDSGEQIRGLPEMWANENLQIARELFKDVRFGKRTVTARGDRWNTELPSGYQARLEKIQAERIHLAGRRLAALLSRIYS
ncbi:S1/P1 nuclease [Undibacterium cyanobacteriorum]|uniref:S1/P1 nuclease n=1 Tax=Undibacterium cyanobacteriorum TaxID=3073561 RepID=A0ABY9RE36_9BURK|nr:S1/P1 nuclease [Undibacterium sp. 20NA77.5]WMW79493.1 S1/P1 nuclease [Undibacterium sp. 20NA77.5]